MMIRPTFLHFIRRGGARALLVLALVLGTLVAAFPPAPSSAQATSPPPVPATNKWALTPTGPDPSTPSEQPDLSYEIAPGSSAAGSVTVWNYSDHALTFRVYATDATTTATGDYDLLPRTQAPTDVGSWVKLSQGSVTVAGHAARVIPLTVDVPAQATPGDHSGGVVASLTSTTTGADGKQVEVEDRTGIRLYTRVTGQLDPSLVVEHVSSRYHRRFLALGGDLDVTYTVRNAGNVRLAAHRQVRVTGPFGWQLGDQHPDDLPELLPGTAVTLTAHFSGIFPALYLSTQVRVEPFAPGLTDPVPGATGSAGTWAVPWVLVLAVVAVTAAGIWRWRKRRRRRAQQRAAAAAMAASLELTV